MERLRFTTSFTQDWQPIILDRQKEQDNQQFEALLAENKVWHLHDTMETQLRGLISTRAFGNKLSEEDIQARFEQILSGIPIEKYGRWVYYPWSGRLVHLLAKDEFIELRTDRNRPKITSQEQQILSEITVGVVGLSVGNAIALTMAQEGIFGHIKLADFDTLELSNMNRIRSCVFDLDLPKTVLAARQIYEINPYVGITLYNGITKDNVESFFTDTPRLNVLVDECDTFDIKFPLRERAKQLGIPVLMEINDRGFLDIERFDLEPNRPIFHGLLEGMDPKQLAGTDMDIKTKALCDIMGLDQLTPRLSVGFFEMHETVSNWAQLASEVMLGGATVANAVRRIVLGDHIPSGRRYIDLEAAVGKPMLYQEPVNGADSLYVPQAKTVDTMGNSVSSIPEWVRHVVHHAAMAPNPDNNQPWQFEYVEDTLYLKHERNRSTSYSDSQAKGCQIAFGAAIENLVIAAAQRNYQTEIQYPSEGEHHDWVAKFRFHEGRFNDDDVDASLFDYIARRGTNRSFAKSAPLTTFQRNELFQLKGSHAKTEFLTEPADLERIADLLGRADIVRFLNKTLNEEIFSLIRWSKDEAELSCDGIDIRTFGLKQGEAKVIKLLSRPDVIDTFNQLKLGSGIRKLTKRAVENASSVGLISIEEDTPRQWIEAGRLLQRIWLTATKLGLAIQPLSGVVVFISHLMNHMDQTILSAEEQQTLAAIRQQLGELIPSWGQGIPAFLFRISDQGEPDVRALRYPLEKILFEKQA